MPRPSSSPQPAQSTFTPESLLNVENLIKVLDEPSNDKLLAKNQHGETILHLLAAPEDTLNDTDYEIAISTILEKLKKLEPNAINAIKELRNDKGETPISVAIQNGNLQAFKIFRKFFDNKVDLQTKNNTGDTLLHIAVKSQSIEIIKLLLKDTLEDINAKNIINAKNNGGNTPLHLAANIGNKDIVALLIDNQNIDLDAQNEQGNSALHIAVENVWIDVLLVQDLVEAAKIKKAQLLNLKNSQDDTPAHKVAQHYAQSPFSETSIEALTYLISQGADKNIKNKAGKTIQQSCKLKQRELSIESNLLLSGIFAALGLTLGAIGGPIGMAIGAASGFLFGFALKNILDYFINRSHAQAVENIFKTEPQNTKPSREITCGNLFKKHPEWMPSKKKSVTPPIIPVSEPATAPNSSVLPIPVSNLVSDGQNTAPNSSVLASQSTNSGEKTERQTFEF